MCGVCGLYGFADSEVPLGRMRRAMVHRGPDSEGSYRAAAVALGARRLAIIDLKTGGQPIYNRDRSMVIVSNGEIYNYREIVRDLTAQGHVFATQSDTEAILHAYEEFGPDCVERLDGMFAFAIWDSRRERLLVARDRLGIKPLYFWRDGAQLAFASEVRALLASGLVPRRLSRAGLESFLAYGAVQEPLTLVEGIHSLLPGHRLRAERGAVVVERYWDPPTGIAPFDEKVACGLQAGALVAISTGDIDALLARWQRARWRLIHPPSHLWYFSAATLGRLLEAVGFAIVRTVYPIYFRSLRTYLGPFARYCPGRLGDVTIPLQTGDLMELYARRR